MQDTPPNKEKLDKSIQRCEKLITYHPKCKWVPDALFLMGKCFLEKGEYGHAVRKFEELRAYYPEHRLADKSRLELGKAYIKEGDYSEARCILEEVEEDKEEATKLVISSYFLSKDYENTVEFGKVFLDNFPKSNFRREIFTIIGISYDSLKFFDLALENYKEALKFKTQSTSGKPDCRQASFELSMSIGNALLSLGKPEEALQGFIALRGIAENNEDLELKIALCYRTLGMFEKAIETLEAIENSPTALYELGVIYEEDSLNLEKAREYYQKVKGPEIAQDALFRASRIGKLTSYREKVQDTTRVEALAKTQFLLAELYFLEFKKIDEALKEYEIVIQNFPQSEYAPKSAYSIAWILEYEKKDEIKALEAYEKVVNDFPDTQYAESAGKAILRLKNESNKE